MTARTTPPFRADHVGSFLRPKYLLEARERFARREIDAAALREVEDRAIAEVVKMQEEAGMQSITDGEFRRTYFHVDFLEQLEGITTSGGIAVSFQSNDGNIDFAPPVMKVTGKVRHVKPIQLADFQFLKSVTRRTPKVTIPSPTMLHFRGGRGAISKEAYPDLDQFFEDDPRVGLRRARDEVLVGRPRRSLDRGDGQFLHLRDRPGRERIRVAARARLGARPGPHLAPAPVRSRARSARVRLHRAVDRAGHRADAFRRLGLERRDAAPAIDPDARVRAPGALSCTARARTPRLSGLWGFLTHG